MHMDLGQCGLQLLVITCPSWHPLPQANGLSQRVVSPPASIVISLKVTLSRHFSVSNVPFITIYSSMSQDLHHPLRNLMISESRWISTRRQMRTMSKRKAGKIFFWRRMRMTLNQIFDHLS